MTSSDSVQRTAGGPVAGRLTGKVALVTGGCRGIGLSDATRLAAEGARVVIGCRHDHSFDGIGTARLDVTEVESWERAVQSVLSEHGRIDVLVNNAGLFRLTPLLGGDIADYMAVVNVNQFGTYLGMRAVAPAMAAQGSGSIVNVSSVGGLVGRKAMVAYVASKFAVRGMTKAAAIELASTGVRVNCIHPGFVATDMLGDGDRLEAIARKIPLGRLGTTGEVAALVAFLASDESSFCTGAEFIADGGESAGPLWP